jgi:type I restriction enzyme S subunit
MPVAQGHDPRFLTYLHQALYGLRVPERSIKQTTGIQNLDSDEYLNEKVALPALAEQRAIADFLDRQTAAIDGLIEMKKRSVALLEEKRQALITTVVTGQQTVTALPESV